MNQNYKVWICLNKFLVKNLIFCRNYLFRLKLDDLHPLEVEEWSPDPVAKDNCLLKGMTEEECHNYIRLLHIIEGQILVCGTFAVRPTCSTRE